MKSALINTLATLGVIFLLIIIAGIYFFITDPYNLKPLVFGTVSSDQSMSASEKSSDTTNEESSDQAGAQSGFTLSAAQQQALIAIGVDPAAVPSTVSAEQTNCFISVLGEARVQEIKAGAVPGAIEFARAKSCI
jgi:cytoskeletal protein RodZ